jgi:hypothetical protein
MPIAISPAAAISHRTGHPVPLIAAPRQGLAQLVQTGSTLEDSFRFRNRRSGGGMCGGPGGP